jgi:oxygen-independent coproporphyrinogen-3 oxidase
MYEWLSTTLEVHGYVQYEISNWALDRQRPKGESQSKDLQPASSDLATSNPAFACRHNLQYWRGLPYLAFGAGAHGYANGYRYSNALRIKTYIERLNTEQGSLKVEFPRSPATVNHHKQSPKDDISEYMMTGLRLIREGVNDQEFQIRFGRPILQVYPDQIDELLKLGLIENSGGVDSSGTFRLTQRGRLLGNQVFMRFV